MHNNYFKMKYDITVMLFCLDMFAFEACIFNLWCYLQKTLRFSKKHIETGLDSPNFVPQNTVFWGY